ncbi:MAG: hypothetical protein ABEI32_05470 [Halothece sp.]
MVKELSNGNRGGVPFKISCIYSESDNGIRWVGESIEQGILYAECNSEEELIDNIVKFFNEPDEF